MTRVLAVHPTADRYGSDRVFIDAVRVLSEQVGPTFVLVGSDGPLVRALRSLPVADVCSRSFPVLRKSLLSPKGIAQYATRLAPAIGDAIRSIRRVRPHVVYVNTITIPHWLVAARLCGVPVLCHVHEASVVPSRLVRLGLISPLGLADVIIVVSAASRAFVTGGLSRLEVRTRVLPNAIDASSWPATSPPDAPPFCILVPGRLSPNKGQDLALLALRQLLDEGLDVRMRLAGDAFPGYESYVSALRSSAVDLQLGDRIDFAGYVEDLAPAYAAAHVVAIPSRTESFGLVAVEAMCSARPVVAASVDGLPELIVSGETGILVEPDDPAALAAGLGEIVRDPAHARRLALNAAEYARTRWSPAQFAEGIVEATDRARARSSRCRA